MPEESQFHMTVVTQKRVPRHHAEQKLTQEANAPGTGENPAEGAHRPQQDSHSRRDGAGTHHTHSGSHSEHRRRSYNDFGTLDLGSLEDQKPEAKTAAAPASAPTNGQLQKEFLDKYNTVLNRRYHIRNRKKTVRILAIIALILAVFLLSMFGIGALRGQTSETLIKPELETLPVETLDLG